MKVGYFYWGFLGDKKFNSEGQELSTPDGNAFYSWSIIRELQKRGHTVVGLATDRDEPGYKLLGKELFNSFATEERNAAYTNMEFGNSDVDFAIIEWRWNIPGRNDIESKGKEGYQPDQELMYEAIDKLNKNGTPFVVFDLDYKLTEEDIEKNNIKNVIELGNKWKGHSVNSKTIQIPFDFSVINEKPIKLEPENKVIYIGNRYERDWCISKYLPNGTVVHGNWIEPGHGDSAKEWPNIEFRKRLNASEIFEPYNNSIVAPLLAKKEYCEMGFMTARIIEAIFYGAVPLFISEYGKDLIATYAGKYQNLLTVEHRRDVRSKVLYFEKFPQERVKILEYLREHLRFMDCKFFVDDVLAMI